jgi:hypothetical protein
MPITRALNNQIKANATLRSRLPLN